jgi:DNA-binding CsgD family transcriptional regulator
VLWNLLTPDEQWRKLELVAEPERLVWGRPTLSKPVHCDLPHACGDARRDFDGPGDARHRRRRSNATDHRIARMVLQELNRPAQPRQQATTDPLSERELEVLRLLARGMSNQEIADTLIVGEATVRSHVSSILRKLQLASRTQAALYALREGFASLDEADLSR